MTRPRRYATPTCLSSRGLQPGSRVPSASVLQLLAYPSDDAVKRPIPLPTWQPNNIVRCWRSVLGGDGHRQTAHYIVSWCNGQSDMHPSTSVLASWRCHEARPLSSLPPSLPRDSFADDVRLALRLLLQLSPFLGAPFGGSRERCGTYVGSRR